jgi:cyclin-dependent kinase-like
MREIRILKALKHPNIVDLIEVFRWKGKMLLVFEYVPHTLLEELENNTSGLSEEETRKYMWQLVRGLNFIHQHNVIHRDIKPENLLISKNGALKICDFGFARFLSTPDTLYTDYVSTRWYRAPELLVGDANYSQGIDIWAIGCLLAELTTGQPLFPGVSDYNTLELIMNTVQGDLTEKQKKVFLQNPQFQDKEIVKSCRDSEALREKIEGMDEKTYKFLEMCLKIDPGQRVVCEELMKSKYLDGLQDVLEKELEEIIKKDEKDFQMRIKSMEGELWTPPIPLLPLKEDDSDEELDVKPIINKESNLANIDIGSTLSKKSDKNSVISPVHNSLTTKNLEKKNSCKDIIDFQNPPLFLKESTYSYSRAKNNTLGVSNNKVNRLVALPQITEVRAGGEKHYLKNGTLHSSEKEFDTCFEREGKPALPTIHSNASQRHSVV